MSSCLEYHHSKESMERHATLAKEWAIATSVAATVGAMLSALGATLSFTDPAKDAPSRNLTIQALGALFIWVSLVATTSGFVHNEARARPDKIQQPSVKATATIVMAVLAIPLLTGLLWWKFPHEWIPLQGAHVHTLELQTVACVTSFVVLGIVTFMLAGGIHSGEPVCKPTEPTQCVVYDRPQSDLDDAANEARVGAWVSVVIAAVVGLAGLFAAIYPPTTWGLPLWLVLWLLLAIPTTFMAVRDSERRGGKDPVASEEASAVAVTAWLGPVFASALVYVIGKTLSGPNTGEAPWLDHGAWAGLCVVAAITVGVVAHMLRTNLIQPERATCAITS